MLTKSDSRLLEDLSALTDGELEPAQVAEACARWRDDSELRGRWHAYQLIGDVLRSEDLAASGTRDAAFLAALRERLANEPVVLAPEPAAAAAPAMRTAARRGGLALKAPGAGFKPMNSSRRPSRRRLLRRHRARLRGAAAGPGRRRLQWLPVSWRWRVC